MKPFIKIILFLSILWIPFLLLATQVEVKTIQDQKDLPEKFCTLWEKGDYLITDGEYQVIIGGSSRPLLSVLNYPASDALGCILSFVPSGNQLVSDLAMGAPCIEINDESEFIKYSEINFIEEKGKDLVFQAQGTFHGEKDLKAHITTTYYLMPQQGIIKIRSILKNTGPQNFKDLNFSLHLSARHKYSFSPFDPENHPELPFRVFQKKGHYIGWINANPFKEDKSLPGELSPGETYQVEYTLLTRKKSDSLLQNIYQNLDQKTERVLLSSEDFHGECMEIVVQDAFTSSVFYRSFLENSSFVHIPLPSGVYSVKAHFFPAVREKLLDVGKDKENVCLLQNVPLGKVKVKITNSKQKFVPGKVTFIGLSPTKSPYFRPQNPIETGKYWETFKNSCYPSPKGTEIDLPVGTYLVCASRGPEYSVDQKIVEIFQEKKQEFSFQIDKIVKTPHLVSVDPHLHTLKSDGQIRIQDRLKSVVGEGVDVAVASDHNYVLDYEPYLKDMGLDKFLSVMVGNEITHNGLIHYNTYPLQVRKNETNNGAINPSSDEVTHLFRASREKNPQALLQVNHPRSGSIGYFNTHYLDLESASYASEDFATSFDILEVMNGPYFYSSNHQSIQDWFHLLNRGYYFPIVGSSDSHTIDKGEPGYSRTYIFVSDEEHQNLKKDLLIHKIKKGRSFVSNGPLISLEINQKYLPGDFLSLQNGKVNLKVEIKGAPWVHVSEVRIVINGERNIIFPVNDGDKETLKYSNQISFTLSKDSWLSAEVLGNRSLFPVLQSSSYNGKMENATLPYALTNPVFVDVDGNGKFDPPLPKNISSFSSSLQNSLYEYD
ncbi:CehA/McbA family metallohydrolase [bacterium]|nr:CehA/McbA family metallohydrolase [bacterium]